MTISCHVFDTGPGTGPSNMETDERLLGWIENHPDACTLRFFDWVEPTLTIGRTQPAIDLPSLPFVRRPTGGGLVQHLPGELSASFCWPVELHAHLFRQKTKAREIYALLHQIFQRALGELGMECTLHTGTQLSSHFLSPSSLPFSLKGEGTSPDQPSASFSGACPPHPKLGEGTSLTFRSQPPSPDIGRGVGGEGSVCFRDYCESDVLWKGQKILGGALRRTRRAFLYQGTLKRQELEPMPSREIICNSFRATLTSHFNLLITENSSLPSTNPTDPLTEVFSLST